MGRITIQVVPRARTTEVAGLYGDAVRVRVAAPPADGAANIELRRFLAERLGVPQASVQIVGGAVSRRKIVEVRDRDAAAIRRSLLPSHQTPDT